MSLHAGFAEIDITPPVGTHKAGWLKRIVSDSVIHPLYARAAVLEVSPDRIAFIQLDTLSIRWTQVNEIRQGIERAYGFPGAHIMVAATHNHAGPAVANVGAVRRDEEYVRTLVNKCVRVFGEALSKRQEAEIGFGHVCEFEVAHNRRVVMRDGTTRTHGDFSNPNALCIEGPIDPEVAVLAARAPDGKLLGGLVNFACHPTHHGGDGALSAGFPGVLAAEMKRRVCPVTLFLNGASGNIHTTNPATGTGMGMEEAGRHLADDAVKALAQMRFQREVALGAASATLQLPFRHVTKEEVAGTVRGSQRFIDPAIYDRGMPELIKRIDERRTQPAEVQALFVGDTAFAGIPAEFFVEHGLRIKRACYPRHALIVGHANGMVGYVPTKQAFKRSGYETTFAGSSRLAPEAGDMLADAAIRLIREHA